MKEKVARRWEKKEPYAIDEERGVVDKMLSQMSSGTRPDQILGFLEDIKLGITYKHSK